MLPPPMWCASHVVSERRALYSSNSSLKGMSWALHINSCKLIRFMTGLAQ